MFLRTLRTHLTSTTRPVILLEGTRNLPEERRGDLVAMSAMLASTLPHVAFRSGNATGSDDAFARGVASVSGSRLELVLPNAGMGRSRRPRTAIVRSLSDVPGEERPQLADESRLATPENHRLFDAYLHGPVHSRLLGKAQYLVRDTLKVIGSPALDLAPATLAIFFTDESRPAGGGTGHTVRLCERHHIPVFTQRQWLCWASTLPTIPAPIFPP